MRAQKIVQVSSFAFHSVFLFSYMHIEAPFIMHCLRLLVVFQIVLNMPVFVRSQIEVRFEHMYRFDLL